MFGVFPEVAGLWATFAAAASSDPLSVMVLNVHLDCLLLRDRDKTKMSA